MTAVTDGGRLVPAMPRCRPVVGSVLWLLAVTAAATRATPLADVVRLDVFVADEGGRPMAGLQADDFSVTEDGGPVAVVDCREVTAANVDGGAHHRSMVVMLDDLLIPAMGTTVVQQIARLVVSRADRDDSVAVVRVAHREDDAHAPQLMAWARIADYAPGFLAPSPDEATADALNTVARIATEVPPDAFGRTAVVCIGVQTVCNPYVPRPRYSAFWRPWQAAVRAATLARVAMYFIDPAGLNGRHDFGDGFADQTGGETFARNSNFGRAVDAIWTELDHYYLLTYSPSSEHKPLHSIRVKVVRRGAHVRTRTVRAE